MSKPRTPKQLVADIEAIRKRIAQCRDDLREVVDEAESLLDSSDRADDDLQRAIDALSELA